MQSDKSVEKNFWVESMEYKISGHLQGQQKSVIIDANDDMEAINIITAKHPEFQISQVQPLGKAPTSEKAPIPKKPLNKKTTSANPEDSPEAFAIDCRGWTWGIRILGYLLALTIFAMHYRSIVALEGGWLDLFFVFAIDWVSAAIVIEFLVLILRFFRHVVILLDR